MNKNYIIRTVGISIAIVIGIMGLIYKFEFSTMYLSNSFFVVGIILFFIGLIFTIGATEIFDGLGYTRRKMFSKDITKEFRTFGEYKEHKNMATRNKNTKDKEKTILVIGGIYLVIGFIMSYI